METVEKKEEKKVSNTILLVSLITIAASLISGVFGGVGTYFLLQNSNQNDYDSTRNILKQDVQVIDEDSAKIDVASSASDAVVSIVITKDVPVFQNSNPWQNFFYGPELNQQDQQQSTQQQEVGAGSGFVISEDGMIVTNRHVVDTEDASYTVIFNDGTKKDAEVLARDTLLDIAFIKVKDVSGLKYLQLGSSESVKVGQSVVAIGNALGEFSNTVSSGIISGLSRDIVASDSNGSNANQLHGLIQTDASINFGNSGGPLLDLSGKVIGVNVAVADGAQNIGFAIPVQSVIDLLQRLDKTSGEIDRPVLGIRYRAIDTSVKNELKLDVDYGALIQGENGSENFAVASGSPADKAGLKSGDIILEVDGVKIDKDNQLVDLIQNKYFGDTVKLLILRDGEEVSIDVLLEKFQ